MRRALTALTLLLGLAPPALAGSTINPGVPATNSALSSAPIRGNFAAAYADINNILGCFAGTTAPLNPTQFQFWCDTTAAPTNVRVKQFDGAQWVATGSINQTTHVYTTGVSNFGVLPPIAVTTPLGVTTFGLDYNSSLTVDGGGNLGLNLSNANIFLAAQTIDLGSGASEPAADAGTGLAVYGADATTARFEATAFGATGVFSARAALGTRASPLTVTSGTLLGSFNAHGYDSSVWTGVGVAFHGYAEGTWTTTSHPGEGCIATTPSASVTLADQLCVHNDGGATLGSVTDEGAGTLNLAGALYNNGTAPTGTGAYVRAASPTLSGTVGAAAMTLSTPLGAASGGTGVANSGTSTLTLSAALTTTGAATPTLAFGSGSYTYTFAASGNDTVATLGKAQSWTAPQTLGTQQSVQGSLVLANTAAGAYSTTVQSSNSATAAWTLTLPTTAGTNGYVLTTNGSGVTSWASVGGGSGCSVSGSQYQILTVNSAATGCTADANASANAGALTLGASGTLGSVTMGNATSGTITLEPATGALGTITVYLPISSGDTLAGIAAAQTLTNKTITSSTDSLGGVTAAFGSDAKGDIYVNGGSSSIIVRLAIGASGTVLQPSSGLPAWTATAALTSLALGGATIGGNALAVTGTVAVTATSVTALAVGQGGSTNPAFVVNSNSGTQVNGLSVSGSATTVAVPIAAVGSDTNIGLTINAKGSGAIGIGSVSTGAVTITPAAVFGAGVTAASLATPSSNIAGSLCSTSAGVFLYNAGGNCYVATASSITYGTTTAGTSVGIPYNTTNGGALSALTPVSGAILYGASATTPAFSALLTLYGVIYGGGSGGAPVATAAGTTGSVLVATTSAAPSWAGAPAGTLTGTTLNSTVVTSSLTSVGALASGSLASGFTVVGAALGGTGVNNGSSTLTLAASLVTTGTAAPTLAFPTGSAYTYTFQASSDTVVGRATTDTLTHKTYSANGTGNVFSVTGSDSASHQVTVLSGNTGTLATSNGALTNGHCVSIDANGNFVDAGGSCTTGGGGGTVNAGAAGQLTYYSATGTVVSGNASLTISAGALTVGQSGSVAGQVIFSGSTSGAVTVTAQAVAGTQVLSLPDTSGAAATFAVSASAPLALNTTTGNLTVTGLTGGVLAGSGPAFTATPTLGASGTLGSVSLGNSTSGTVTLQTVGGALGSVVASLPANTGVLAETNYAQTWSVMQTYSAQIALTAALTVASGASATLDNFGAVAETTTISGSTNITTTKGFNLVSLYQPTFSAASALTITNANTLYVEAPSCGGAGPATCTNLYAITVGIGNVNFPGTANVLGTITSGTWNGTAIAGAQGGTGLTTAAIGDVMYASATTPTWSRLADVATGSLLASGGVGTAPAYCAACTLTTSLTTPLIAGGTTASSTLTLESTSGAGTSDSIIFKVASQSTALTITTAGIVEVAGAGSAAAPSLTVGDTTTGFYTVSTTGFGITEHGVLKLDYGITTSAIWTSPVALDISATTAASSTSTGAFYTAGGIGVAKASYFGGLLTTTSAGSAAAPSLSVGNVTTGFYSVSTTGLGFSVNGALKLDYGITTSAIWTSPVAFDVTATTVSSSTATGAIIDAGGLGVAGNIWAGGTLNNLTIPAVTDTIATLNTADQAQAGGVHLTAYSVGTKSSGTYTPDCGNNPHQFLFNTGMTGIAAPTASVSANCIVSVINGPSAGVVALSGFASSPTGTGDPFTTAANTASGTATFTNSSANVTYTSTLVVGQVVYFTNSGGGLPTNFTANIPYYVLSNSGTVLTVSGSPGGSVVTAGSAGTGTQTIHIPSVYALEIIQVNGLNTALWKQQQ